MSSLATKDDFEKFGRHIKISIVAAMLTTTAAILGVAWWLLP